MPKRAGPGLRQFNVLLPAELVRDMKIAAIERDATLTQLVEQIFRDYLGHLIDRKGKR